MGRGYGRHGQARRQSGLPQTNASAVTGACFDALRSGKGDPEWKKCVVPNVETLVITSILHGSFTAYIKMPAINAGIKCSACEHKFEKTVASVSPSLFNTRTSFRGDFRDFKGNGKQWEKAEF